MERSKSGPTVAQSWRVSSFRPPRSPARARPPLDAAGLERLGLAYVGRYATSRARLIAYLRRKIAERGFEGGEPPVEALAARFAEAGYVDDRALAEARGRALARRGLGARRLGPALAALGIGEEAGTVAREEAAAQAWTTALRFAERRRIGPYAPEPPDEDARRRAFAAMVRAGHAPDIARKIISAFPGEIPEHGE
jgi:regulatory protein